MNIKEFCQYKQYTRINNESSSSDKSEFDDLLNRFLLFLFIVFPVPSVTCHLEFELKVCLSFSTRVVRISPCEKRLDRSQSHKSAHDQCREIRHKDPSEYTSLTPVQT